MNAETPMKNAQGVRLPALAAITFLSASTAFAHPGINDHKNVMAAMHDLEHATVNYPALTAIFLGLAASIVAYRALRTFRKNRPKQSTEMKTRNT